MPGFSRQDQQRLALLVLGCRGGLDKVAPALADASVRAQMLALRLAVLFHHARRPIDAAAHPLRPAARSASTCPATLAQGAPADRAPAREGARRVEGRGLAVEAQLSLGSGFSRTPLPGLRLSPSDVARTGRTPGRARSRPSARPPTSPSRSRSVSHQTAPFFIDQTRLRRRAASRRPRRASADDRRPARARANPASRPRRAPVGARAGRELATVLNLRPSASAVCCVRAAGDTRMRVVSGRCRSSHAAMRSACLMPFAVRRRPRSGSPGSASA